jgi:hypothetical protein
VVGREKFLKLDFFNYIKIKNHKKLESKKTKKLEHGKNKAHDIRRILYGVSPPPPVYYTWTSMPS